MNYYTETYTNSFGTIEYIRGCRSETEMPETKAEFYMLGNSKGKPTGGTFEYKPITEAEFKRIGCNAREA